MSWTVAEKFTLQGRNGKTVIGTFASTGSTGGGDIKTGLVEVYHVNLSFTSATGLTYQVNETLPLAGGTVTVAVSADSTGTYEIIGQ